MYQHILVPIDPANVDQAGRLIEVAKHLSSAKGKITILSVLEPIPSYIANYIPGDTLEKNRKELLHQLQSLARKADIDSQFRIRPGSPAHVIVEEAEGMGCDAIVLASHRPDYRDYLIGSTASRVVRHAKCTVIVERSTAVSTVIPASTALA